MGGCRIGTEFGANMFVPYFPAILVMLELVFPSIGRISSTWQMCVSDVIISLFSLYLSCQKFQMFDVLRVSIAENSRVNTNPCGMVVHTTLPQQVLLIYCISFSFDCYIPTKRGVKFRPRSEQPLYWASWMVSVAYCLPLD